MIPNYYEFKNPVKIISGQDAIHRISGELVSLACKKPFILTGPHLLKIGVTSLVLHALDEEKVTVGGVFSEIPADSSAELISTIAAEYRKNHCDGIIAVGGGSVIDTAKGVKLLISQGGTDILAYQGSECLRPGRKVPFVVVPTTAGTGSEATLVAVIADEKSGRKIEFISYDLVPDVAVLDPRTTLSVPPHSTASTGMDTLCHAIEAASCLQKNPVSDAFAYAAIKLIGESLVPAVENGADPKFRLEMANASILAGIAFSNSMVGLVHAIAHACGAVCHISHADAISVLLPHVMEYNMDTLGSDYGRMLFCIAGSEQYSSIPQTRRGLEMCRLVKQLTGKLHELCGLPVSLKGLNVNQSDFKTIAQKALGDGAILLNPKHAEENDIVKILNSAYQ